MSNSADSKAIDVVDYDGKSVLDITFKTGQVYRFLGVPENIFEGLERAPSKGRYFQENIRNRYNWSKLNLQEKKI